MAENLKFVCVMLLVGSCFFLVSEARPLGVHGGTLSGSERMQLEELYIREVKSGGPSSGGEGHSFINSRNLRVTTKSGPSPGEGH
ncbi:hypothetical protein G2W53_012915 [Senna tora]|uniref:Uncharacterized protein n=1 Tax=Senna tora TaxID=362788 RepID=A0A834TYC9_9FABA|nr:hypothetical protein G2W53_012915 [Senna tora]